jgi:hypothetical protein
MNTTGQWNNPGSWKNLKLLPPVIYKSHKRRTVVYVSHQILLFVMPGHSSVVTSNAVIYLYINHHLTVSMSTIARPCTSTCMHVAPATVRETLSVVHFEDVADTGKLSSCDTLNTTEPNLFVTNTVMSLVQLGMLFFVENLFAFPFLEILPYSNHLYSNASYL